MNLATKTTNIAITGIAGGGKTVFLTSLLSMLAESDGEELFCGGKTRLSRFYEPNFNKTSGNFFPRDIYRRKLSDGTAWPDKTVDCFKYECEFERSDWRFSKQRLRFFDFPGERIADAAIAAMSDYRQWSNHILSYYKHHPDYESAAKEYFDMLKGGNINMPETIAKYKLTLARLILGFKPLISPSCFLLDTAGSSAKPGTAEQIANSRHTGIDERNSFAPLPEDICKANPAIASEMRRNYRLYREKVVLPVFKELSKSHCLVILIDIPSLLAGGVGRYNDNRQILLDITSALRPDTSIGGKLLGALKFWKPKLRKAAFIASKADMVCAEDRDNGNLYSLLHQMTSRAAGLLPDVESKWFVCSGCCSTRPSAKPGHLIGKLAYNNPEGKEMEFEVSRLPSDWQPQWASGDYRFYKVYPQASPNVQTPPKNIGMDGILKFIIG